MNHLSTNDRDRRLEQIVAYLDGELSPAEASQVEQQLTDDAQFRQELADIERAWTALDVLPNATVDDRFAQTTMELVVGAAREEVLEKTRALPVMRRKNLLSKLLLLAAAVALGMLMMQLLRENPNRLLLSNLPPIEYIGIYSQFQDVEFLEQLNRALGDDVWVAELSEEALTGEVARFHTVADASQRRDWITALDEEDHAALRARYNRFAALSPGEQQRLRDLHTSLISAPDSEKLLRTMLQYQAWLNALPASRQFELRDMELDDRVQEIVTEIRREANSPWIDLSPDEAGRLDRTLHLIREQMTRDLRTSERGRHRGRERGPGFPQLIREHFQTHRDEWLPLILDALSTEHRAEFVELQPRQQQQQVLRWFMQSRGRDEGRRGSRSVVHITQQELERFFVEDTNPAEKERLLALPRDQMQQQLKRRYFRGEANDEADPPHEHPGPPSRGDRRGAGPRRGLRGPGEPNRHPDQLRSIPPTP